MFPLKKLSLKKSSIPKLDKLDKLVQLESIVPKIEKLTGVAYKKGCAVIAIKKPLLFRNVWAGLINKGTISTDYIASLRQVLPKNMFSSALFATESFKQKTYPAKYLHLIKSSEAKSHLRFCFNVEQDNSKERFFITPKLKVEKGYGLTLKKETSPNGVLYLDIDIGIYGTVRLMNKNGKILTGGNLDLIKRLVKLQTTTNKDFFMDLWCFRGSKLELVTWSCLGII